MAGAMPMRPPLLRHVQPHLFGPHCVRACRGGISYHTGLIDKPQHHEAEWEGLRLVVEEREEHWQAFVYDAKSCEVVYTASRMSLGLAKLAAVEFVANYVFGPQHGLNLETIAVMLLWELVEP
jgi:hypothetical protein